MKVGELIELLEECDPDAEVMIMSQPAWPFEYGVSGVIRREDFEHLEEGEIPDEDKNQNDVFLLEGTQLRYGNKEAWNEI